MQLLAGHSTNTFNRLTAGKVVAKFSAITNKIESLVAETNVFMQQDHNEATGQLATLISNAGEEIMKLTGSPVARTPESTMEAEVMLWDLKSNIFKGIGAYKIRFNPEKAKTIVPETNAKP